MAGLFIYGSCVSRDAYDPPVSGIQLHGYVARQSLISAFSNADELQIDLSPLASSFQRRMVAGDIAGDLANSIESAGGQIDLIMWDLTDERMGVLEIAPGVYVTPSEELLRLNSPKFKQARHIAFGSDEHFILFYSAAKQFAEWLRIKGAFSSVLVINTPHTSAIAGGGGEAVEPGQLEALAQRAKDWNDQAARYYTALEDIGFRLRSVHADRSAIEPAHRWGIAPFHSAEQTYEAMRELVDAALVEPCQSVDNTPGTWRSVSYEEYLYELGGLWPNGLSAAPSSLGWLITLPNGQSVEVHSDAEQIDWDQRFERDQATSTLWLRSLIFLPLLEKEGAHDLVDRILAGYEIFMRSSVESPEFFRTESLDHAIALNLHTLCHLKMLRSATTGLGRHGSFAHWVPLVSLLERLARSDRVFRWNNHGMFLCVSLFNARWFWTEVAGKRAPVEDDEARVRALLRDSFSHEGVTVENTPHYQEIWVYLVRQCLYIARGLERQQLASYLAWIHARIREAFLVMLLPTGNVPPFGDGKLAPSRELEPIDGLIYSPSVGLFVKHDGPDYFAVKCGSASPVHKHLDDTAIFLMVDGVELIGDMGLVNYDSFDNDSSLVRGQLGHSSVAFKELDRLPQSFVYPATGEVASTASLSYRPNGGRDFITTSATLLGAYTVERHVELRSIREFILRDEARTRYGASAVQRFVFPSDVDIEISDGNVVVSRQGLTMTVRFEAPVSGDTVSIGQSPIGSNLILERPMTTCNIVYTAHVSVTGIRVVG